MSKELEALESLEKIKKRIYGEMPVTADVVDDDLYIIETALKENSELRTRNYELLKESERFYNQRNEYKRVLEIIKEKIMPFVNLYDNRVYDNEEYEYRELTQEEFDLLKEVLL